MGIKTAACILILATVIFSGCAPVENSIFDFGLSMERSKSNLRLKTIGINNHTYYYLERHGDGETVLFIHGFMGNKDTWLHFVRHLPKDLRAIAIDLPGHGDNVRDITQKHTPVFFAKEVARMVNKLKLKRFHLVGISMGGYVSQLYAADNSDKILTLALFDSGGVISPTPSDLQSLLNKGKNPFMIRSREDYNELLKYCFHKPPTLIWPARNVLARRLMSNASFNKKMWDDIIQSVPMKKEEDSRKLLSRLHMPTLVIWGEKDRLAHVSSTRIFKKQLPKPVIVIFKNCGHVPPVELPGKSAEHFTKFIKDS